jgi:hypothetical protein
MQDHLGLLHGNFNRVGRWWHGLCCASFLPVVSLTVLIAEEIDETLRALFA